MGKTEENKIVEPVIKEDGGEGSMLSQLVRLSVKTLYYMLLILTVLAVFISQRFPYFTMRSYYDMEDYKTALVYAQKYAKRGGKNYTEALHYGIEMSDNLLHSAKNQKDIKTAAEYLLYFTERFADLDDFEARCTNLDAYYQAGATSTAAKVGLYSYKDYIYSSNAAAQSVLSKDIQLMCPWENKYITVLELQQLLKKIADGQNHPKLCELALLFNQISQNIVHGQGSLIYSDFKERQEVTATYGYILLCLVGEEYPYISRVAAMEKSLERLYLLEAAARLGKNIKEFFGSKGQADKLNEATDSFLIEFEGKTITLYQYYIEQVKNF